MRKCLEDLLFCKHAGAVEITMPSLVIKSEDSAQTSEQAREAMQGVFPSKSAPT